MTQARFIVGDALTELRKLPDASIDLVLTSPPFLALRSYLPADHPSKHLEIGSEPDPGTFIDSLMAVIVECRRVLAPHGSLCVELGDTYAGAMPPYRYTAKHSRDGLTDRRDAEVNETVGRDNIAQRTGEAWPLPKSLALIPQTLAYTLAYGTNPHTGIEYEPWRVRNIIRWVRPNPPVGALGDKFRPATSEMVVACVSASRFFDLDAVREPHKQPDRLDPAGAPDIHDTHRLAAGGRMGSNPVGAPPLDWWNIPTHPYKGSHYATWPPELCVKPIKAMCPERVCVTCGEPSRRIVERETGFLSARGVPPGGGSGEKIRPTRDGSAAGLRKLGHDTATTTRVIGEHWSDCGHGTWRPGLVLDPFAGTGTTLAVATGHSRDAIGVDLDERNAELAVQRIGPLLCTVE